MNQHVAAITGGVSPSGESAFCPVGKESQPRDIAFCSRFRGTYRILEN
jgi:hypothetical protein